MSGVDPSVAATIRESRGVAGGAAKERGTTPSQSEKADVLYHATPVKVKRLQASTNSEQTLS